MRLDYLGIKLHGLLQFRKSVSGLVAVDVSQTGEIMQLRRLGVGLHGRTKRCYGAIKLLVAGVPAAQKDGIICGGMGFELCDQIGRTIADSVGGRAPRSLRDRPAQNLQTSSLAA